MVGVKEVADGQPECKYVIWTVHFAFGGQFATESYIGFFPASWRYFSPSLSSFLTAALQDQDSKDVWCCSLKSLLHGLLISTPASRLF